MFECVTTHYLTLQTWIDHNATCYQKLRNVLPRVTVKFIKKCVLIFFKKIYGNVW